MKRVLVLNGPNLDRLGERLPHIYGTTTLARLEADLTHLGEQLGLEVSCVQSSQAHALIQALEKTAPDAVVINPAALTHYSYALADALAASGAAVFEVHITNIHAREAYRRLSVVSPVAVAVVMGMGASGYRYALEAAAAHLARSATKED